MQMLIDWAERGWLPDGLSEFSYPFGPIVPKFGWIDRMSFEERKFLSSNNPLAYALMAKMDYDRKQRVQLKAEFLRLILGCPVDAARRSLLIEFVETYVPLTGSEEREFEQIVRRD